MSAKCHLHLARPRYDTSFLRAPLCGVWQGGSRLVPVQDTWNLTAVLPIVSLSSDATLPAHNASAINSKTGKAAPAFRGAVPPANKAAAPRDKNATQAARPLLTADVCLTTKKGVAISNKASSKCHLPFRCLYNYTMEVRAPYPTPHRMAIYPVLGPCVGFSL